MNNQVKTYDELTFGDDFAFCKIMQNNQNLCAELLEMILGKKVHIISTPEAQKTMKATPDGKGIRMDVYVEDDKDIIYDIEMQTTSNRNLPKRSRYYQSMLDIGQLETGASYLALKRTYVIFICPFDYFELGYHRYCFTSICKGVPELELKNEVNTIFLCAGGSKDDATPRQKAFLDYLVNRKTRDAFTEKLEEAVSNIFYKNEKWRVEYMMIALRDQDNQEIGKEIGKKIGKEIGKDSINQLVQRLIADDRLEDLKRSTQDKEYQKQLMHEYKIED